jgi:hypothetical protein
MANNKTPHVQKHLSNPEFINLLFTFCKMKNLKEKRNAKNQMFMVQKQILKRKWSLQKEMN